MSNKEKAAKENLNVVKLLISEGKKNEALEELLDLNDEDFQALAAIALDGVQDGDKGFTALIEAASFARNEHKLKKAGEHYKKWLLLDTDDEREEYVKALTPENQSLLNQIIWSQRTGKEAFVHLMKRAAVPTPKRAAAALVAGGLATTGAAITGTSATPAVLTGVGVAVLVDGIIVGFEEDEATRRFGQGLRSLFIDRPRNWLQRLAVKEEG